METEQCDICVRECDGVHNNKIYTKKIDMQIIISVLENYDKKFADEVIKQIYENQRLKCKKV